MNGEIVNGKNRIQIVHHVKNTIGINVNVWISAIPMNAVMRMRIVLKSRKIRMEMVLAIYGRGQQNVSMRIVRNKVKKYVVEKIVVTMVRSVVRIKVNIAVMRIKNVVREIAAILMKSVMAVINVVHRLFRQVVVQMSVW